MFADLDVFIYLSTVTYVVGTQSNNLNVTILSQHFKTDRLENKSSYTHIIFVHLDLCIDILTAKKRDKLLPNIRIKKTRNVVTAP